MDNQLRREYGTMFDTLKRCQQECTRLLLENRALKDKFSEIDGRVAALRGELDRRHRAASLHTEEDRF